MRESEPTTPVMASGDQALMDQPETSNRRSAVRGLAAALLALAGGGAAVADATRKRKKNKKKGKGNSGKKPRNRCRPGLLLASLAVPANGSEVFTPALTKGDQYTLRASGFWSTNGEFMNDAVAAFPFANPALPTFTDGGVRLGLSVDGRSPDIWGAYSLGHEYTTSVVGQGRGVSLRMQDSVFSDNGRLLNVDVICG
jgi:hypothetical protein